MRVVRFPGFPIPGTKNVRFRTRKSFNFFLLFLRSLPEKNLWWNHVPWRISKFREDEWIWMMIFPRSRFFVSGHLWESKEEADTFEILNDTHRFLDSLDLWFLCSSLRGREIYTVHQERERESALYSYNIKDNQKASISRQRLAERISHYLWVGSLSVPRHVVSRPKAST